MTMIIKVEISDETWARLLTGKRIEGTLGYDRLGEGVAGALQDL